VPPILGEMGKNAAKSVRMHSFGKSSSLKGSTEGNLKINLHMSDNLFTLRYIICKLLLTQFRDSVL